MGHSILFKQCSSDRMTRRRSRAIDRIVIHYTATLASARNNAIYFSHNERQGSSARYFVGDITDEIYQSVAEGDTAWHAGNWLMNCRSVDIEAVSASEDYSEVEAGKLAWLVQTLMKRYGISEGGVIRRYDVTGKICPAPYIAAGRRAALLPRICRGAGSSDTVAAGPSGSGGSAPSGDVASLAWRVINEEFGNGEARKRALGSRYLEVQAEVNRILSGGGSGGSSSSGSGEVDIDALARTVINGDYGNGEERKRRLGSNSAAVQRCVSQMLSCGGFARSWRRAGNRGLYPCVAGGGRSHANRLDAWIDIQQIILFDERRRSSLACASLFGRSGGLRTILNGALPSVAECKR